MSYLVTARKWRPTLFSEVVGQQHITQTLKNAILNGRVAHAYLFAGPRGVGKTTTARIMAKVLNCKNPKDGEPCNKCEMCNAFNSSQSLDIIEIDGASNRRIEEIRTLRESVKYAPTKGTHKVYIIDEVHMLTIESFNALLKTLEEPPEHTIFIFATTDVHKVPSTIISRCQRYDFRRIELNTIKDLLNKIAEAENITIDDKSLTIIGKKADGALRDAESIFDQVVSFCGNNIEADVLTSMLNLIDEDIYFSFTDAILEKNFAAAFDITEELYNKGWNFIDFVNGMTEHFRNILAAIVKKDSSLIESAEMYKEKYMEYIKSFSEADILKLLNYSNRLNQEIKFAQNQRVKIEISLAHMISLEKTETISNLLEKLKSANLSGYNVNTVPGRETDEKKKPERVTSSTPPETKQVKQESPKEKSSPKPPSTNVPVDFKTIKSRWAEFVDTITDFNYKLLLGDAKPQKYFAGKLTIRLGRQSDKDVIKSEKTFTKQISTSAQEFFGKEMSIELTTPDTLHREEIEFMQSDQPNTQLVDAIINELGGKEYKTN
ncbi:MAG: hypothetical protein SCALA702_17850 [Melioribacteraceae bacterium]|nr:MAG: hypothetical protein SCALA702_17850 [Melioribacteraceae bacterium]